MKHRQAAWLGGGGEGGRGGGGGGGGAQGQGGLKQLRLIAFVGDIRAGIQPDLHLVACGLCICME